METESLQRKVVEASVATLLGSQQNFLTRSLPQWKPEMGQGLQSGSPPSPTFLDRGTHHAVEHRVTPYNTSPQVAW